MLTKPRLSKAELRAFLHRATRISVDDETLWHNTVRYLWEKCGDDPYSSTPYNTWLETLQRVLAGRFQLDFVPDADLLNEALEAARTNRDWKGSTAY